MAKKQLMLCYTLLLFYRLEIQARNGGQVRCETCARARSRCEARQRCAFAGVPPTAARRSAHRSALPRRPPCLPADGCRRTRDLSWRARGRSGRAARGTAETSAAQTLPAFPAGPQTALGLGGTASPALSHPQSPGRTAERGAQSRRLRRARGHRR